MEWNCRDCFPGRQWIDNVIEFYNVNFKIIYRLTYSYYLFFNVSIIFYYIIRLLTISPSVVFDLQHAGARDERGNPVIKDFYSSPLTARFAFLLPDLKLIFQSSSKPNFSLNLIFYFFSYPVEILTMIHYLWKLRLSILVQGTMGLQWSSTTAFLCL